MKVTNKMIDKQLRFKGMILRLLLKRKNEKQYIKSAYKSKKILNKSFSGRDVKGLNCSETWIKRKNEDSKIRVRIYKSLNSKENSTGVLWLHGGGYSLGVPELNDKMYKKLIDETNCIIIAPDYRLSIDAPYPAALEDCYETLLWMKNNAKELGIRENQIMVGGESAGGGLTAALTLYARDRGEVNIAFQMPLYPMIDDQMSTESAMENNAPVWDSDQNRWAWKLYLGELFEKDVPEYAAALRAKNYKQLPPTVTFVGELEPFRDETIQYVNNLRNAGVPVDFKLFKGCYHAFDMMCSKAEVSKQATSFLITSFKYAIKHYFAEQN
jgi:acetyl esterase/lipase